MLARGGRQNTILSPYLWTHSKRAVRTIICVCVRERERERDGKMLELV